MAKLSPESGEAEGVEKAAMEKTAGWLREQVEHVWRAVSGGETMREEDKDLQVRRVGGEMYYSFMYKGKIAAEARSYFWETENKWMFELTQVEKEYYSNVRDYFSKRI